MKSAASFTGGIQAWSGQPSQGKISQHHSEDLSITWIIGPDSLWSSLFGQTLLSQGGSSGTPQSTRSLTAVRNYSLKCGKADKKLIFQLFYIGSQPKGQEAIYFSSVQWPEREKYHYSIMKPFFRLGEIILMFPRTLPRPCGDYRVK